MMLSQVEEMREQLRPSERKLADYVIEAPREVLDLSMTEVAARAGVSQPTIARFCHALGFSGFREFKIRLAQGIASIESHFDVVILDPPPALGTISLSVMRAANALLVPVPPTVVDFTSTTTFLAMLHETMGVLEEQGLPIELQWMRMVATRADEQKSMQRELLGVMRGLFGEMLLRTVLKDSAEIDNASARLMTVYDLERPVTSRETYQRCLTYLNGVNAEIETLVRLTWPSHAGRLRTEGVI